MVWYRICPTVANNYFCILIAPPEKAEKDTVMVFCRTVPADPRSLDIYSDSLWSKLGSWQGYKATFKRPEHKCQDQTC